MNYISYIKKLLRCKRSISGSNTSDITRNLLNEESPSAQVLSKQKKAEILTVLRFQGNVITSIPILEYLNINSLRNKIDALRIVLERLFEIDGY